MYLIYCEKMDVSVWDRRRQTKDTNTHTHANSHMIPCNGKYGQYMNAKPEHTALSKHVYNLSEPQDIICSKVFSFTIHKLIRFHMNAFRFNVNMALSERWTRAQSYCHCVIATKAHTFSKNETDLVWRWEMLLCWLATLLKYYFGIWMLGATINVALASIIRFGFWNGRLMHCEIEERNRNGRETNSNEWFAWAIWTKRRLNVAIMWRKMQNRIQWMGIWGVLLSFAACSQCSLKSSLSKYVQINWKCQERKRYQY